MQNNVVENIRLDVNRVKNKAAIYVRMGDTLTRTLHFTIANNGTLYDLKNLIFAEILIKRPDGSEADNELVMYSNYYEKDKESQEETEVVDLSLAKHRWVYA